MLRLLLLVLLGMLKIQYLTKQGSRKLFEKKIPAIADVVVVAVAAAVAAAPAVADPAPLAADHAPCDAGI